MKKLLILLFNCFIVGLFIALFLTTGQVFAQTAQKTPEEIAKEKGITFPIQELGNCANFSECRNFCEDPVNRNTCTDFAKSKGFYQETSTKHEEILKSAKDELGCDSESSCRTVCEQEANHDKCFAFAKKHSLGGGQVHDPSKSEILEKAKTILGCNSYESCKSFCEQETNREKCSEFAKQTGLRGGEHEAGPGGCTSEETCKAFCSDSNNYQICSGFTSSTGGKFSGPGGCDSEESCRAYCEKNPSACGSIGGRSEASHEEYCNRTPNCSWTNNTCQCSSGGGTGTGGDYEKYCRENPDKCKPPTQDQNINPQDYCKQYPERCNQQNFSPSPTYSPGTGGYPTEDFSTQSTSSPTTQTETQYQTQSSPYPTTQPTGTVQGASAKRGFLENFLQFILTLK